MKKTLDFFKKEFAHDAVELKECLQLLSECMDGTIQNISEKAASCFSNRDFEKMKSYQDCVTELDSLQVKLESYMALVDLDDATNDYDNEDEIITEHAAEKDDRKINYADYAVDENTEYSLIDDFTHKRPAGFKLQNQRYVANDWKDVFVKTCSALAERNLSLFEGLVSDPTMQGKKVVYFAYSPAAMRKPELISGTKIYAHTNLSANQIRNIIQKMLRKFGISTSDYKMYLKADYTCIHRNRAHSCGAYPIQGGEQQRSVFCGGMLRGESRCPNRARGTLCKVQGILHQCRAQAPIPSQLQQGNREHGRRREPLWQRYPQRRQAGEKAHLARYPTDLTDLTTFFIFLALNTKIYNLLD